MPSFDCGVRSENMKIYSSFMNRLYQEKEMWAYCWIGQLVSMLKNIDNTYC